jgi:hypothetical protein
LPDWLLMLRAAHQKNETDAAVCILSFLAKDMNNHLAVEIQNALTGQKYPEQRIAYQSLYLLAAKLNHRTEMARTIYHLVLNESHDILLLKQVLNALARNCEAASLPFVTPFMKDPQAMQEAANYYLSLAYKLAKEKKDAQSLDLLIEAAGVSQYRYAVQRVLTALEKNGLRVEPAEQKKLARRAGFVNQWWIAGPFPNENDKAERISYFPEKQIDFSQRADFDSLTAAWERVNLDGIYPVIPFAEKYGKRQLAAYAYATIKLAEEREVIFKIGSNDGVICWVNGQKVHENLIARGLVVDEDEVNLSLRKGINRILLKVPNKGADWELCLRMCDAEGKPLNLNQYNVTNE